MSERVALTVNGRLVERDVESRLLLSDFLRHELGLTGTHVGCEHGVCGACTILIDGAAARSCLTLAVQVDGSEVVTIEGLSQNGALHPVQEAFRAAHALQCGFCTPGFVMAVVASLAELGNEIPDDEACRKLISGNLCRCTGYQNIIRAVQIAAEALAGEAR